MQSIYQHVHLVLSKIHRLFSSIYTVATLGNLDCSKTSSFFCCFVYLTFYSKQKDKVIFLKYNLDSFSYLYLTLQQPSIIVRLKSRYFAMEFKILQTISYLTSFPINLSFIHGKIDTLAFHSTSQPFHLLFLLGMFFPQYSYLTLCHSSDASSIAISTLSLSYDAIKQRFDLF